MASSLTQSVKAQAQAAKAASSKTDADGDHDGDTKATEAGKGGAVDISG